MTPLVGRGNPSPVVRRAMRKQWRRNVLRVASPAVGVAAVLAMLGLVVGPATWLIAGGTVRRLHGKEQADALNAVRQTLLASLVGAAGLGGLAFTARTYFLSRRGQVTDRFSAAIAHLASKELEERLGGIYALEHVMAESGRDHATVIEVLCAFVRSRSPRDPATAKTTPAPGKPWPEPVADIDAVLTVLARRPRRAEPNRPDLRATDLSGLSLRIFEFTQRPNLKRVFLTGADLTGADLRGVDLSRTILNDADLVGAALDGAALTNALLTRTRLRGARLGHVDLRGADLTGADLSDVEGLIAAQLAQTVIDDETVLPDSLKDDPWIAARIVDCQRWVQAPNDESGVYRGPARTPKP